MIDYQIITDSINYYEAEGFKRIESPWTVSKYVDDLTKPKGVTSFELKHNDKCLVASGEQSFLYLYLKDYLPLGQFQTVTPCWRYENFDYTHSKYFIKNELIKTDKVDTDSLEEIVEICVKFYNQYLPVDVVKTEGGFDIEWAGNELGSYGIRTCPYLKWIYATGVAEPRLSKIINLYKNGLS